MKKFVTGLIVGLLLATSIMTLAGMQPIKLIVNGNEVFSDVPPQIIDGRTMIPARPLAEALGAKVEWDAENSAVVVTGGVQVGATPIDLENVGENNENKNIMNNTIKKTTFEGMEAIVADDKIYFYHLDYRNKINKSLNHKCSYLEDKDFKKTIIVQRGDEIKIIPVNLQNGFIYENKFYIKSEHYFY